MTKRGIRQLLILSNGVFAISFTLLVLNIDVPVDTSDTAVSELLRSLQPEFIAFGISVFVIGIIWRNHQGLFNEFSDVDTTLIWLNIFYLAAVALIPFPNRLLSQHQADPLAYVVFALLLIVIFSLDALMLIYAKHAGLLHVGMRIGGEYRAELYRSLVSILIFGASIPLAFILVAWTPFVWILSLFADYLLVSIIFSE